MVHQPLLLGAFPLSSKKKGLQPVDSKGNTNPHLISEWSETLMYAYWSFITFIFANSFPLLKKGKSYRMCTQLSSGLYSHGLNPTGLVCPAHAILSKSMLLTWWSQNGMDRIKSSSVIGSRLKSIGGDEMEVVTSCCLYFWYLACTYFTFILRVEGQILLVLLLVSLFFIFLQPCCKAHCEQLLCVE